MNLHAVAGPAVAAVNPTVTARWRASIGSIVGADGTPTPTYAPPVNVPAQVQALTYKDLTQIDALNQNGVRRGIYLYGTAQGVVRPTHQGGDLLEFDALTDFPAGSTWLINQVLEQWPGWCKVAATLQNGS